MQSHLDQNELILKDNPGTNLWSAESLDSLNKLHYQCISPDLNQTYYIILFWDRSFKGLPITYLYAKKMRNIQLNELFWALKVVQI